MAGNIQDSSFVITTGPPQKDKRQRISHVRSFIRKSRLQREKKLVRRRSAMSPLERPLRKEMDLSWLPVSDAVRVRLSTFLHHYIEASAEIHPFFYSVVPAVDFHVPLMSAKLMNASAWDDLNTNGEISSLTVFQRNIAEGIMSNYLAESESANSDANLLAFLTLLAFEIINGDREAYTRLKSRACQLIDMRGGLNKLGFNGNLKISLLLQDQLERVVLPFHPEEATPPWEHRESEMFLPQPPDFKIFTIRSCSRDSWPGLSTIRFLSDFYELVTFSIRCSFLSDDVTCQRYMLSQWYTLRDRMIAPKSNLFSPETKLDEILQKAILLFISDERDLQSRHQHVVGLRHLLCDFRIDIYSGPLLGALIWCLVVGSRCTSPGNIRKWYMMQLMRISCPLSLDYYEEVANNLNVILTGLDAARALGNVEQTADS